MKKYSICNIDLSKIHDQLFQLLVEVDRICRKHNIHYTIEGGTMLGAAKYGDFVPWDDDLDVVMLREDYDKFLEICDTELDKKFFIQYVKSEPDFPLNYAKLRLNGSKYLQKSYEFLDIHQGLFLDIFPFDYADPKHYMMKVHILGLLNGAKCVKLGLMLSRLYPSPKCPFFKRTAYRMAALLPLHFINNAIQRIIKCGPNDKKYVYNFCNPMYSTKPTSAQRFNEYTEVVFRKRKFYAVKDYRSWLKESFGDYMNEEPDELTRGPSHEISECQLLEEQTEKKIGILMLFREDNYGTVLQAYALSHAVSYMIQKENAKMCCEIVDYIDPTINSRHRISNPEGSPKLIGKLKYLYLGRIFKKNHQNFNIFRKSYLSISKQSYTRSNIRDVEKEYDLFITDSGQKWDVLVKDKDCICYHGLRESKEKILDPVFLLEKNDYVNVESKKKIIEGKYILVYAILFEKELCDFAYKLSKETGFKIEYININKPYKKGVHNLRDVPVPHFLSLIKNASYVVTSSFYGIAFSLIYNTEVYYKPSKGEGNSDMRTEMLAYISGIKNRDISCRNMIISDKINWEQVNQRIADMRKELLDSLDKSIFR